MAPVVVVGVNSWCTIAEADAYFEAKFGASAWSPLSVSQKTQLLITACRWIRQQSQFSVELSSTAELVKHAQLEAAWFVFQWFDEYEKRRALTSSGVRAWKALDASETLEAVGFPAFIADMLSDFTTGVGGVIASVHRDMEGNALGE